MRLRNISPMGQIDVPIIGRQGEPLGESGVGCLEPGEEFDVDDAVAGRAPITDPDTGIFDAGTGLLALAGVFESVADTKKGAGK